jgi:p-aminobenzoyl-glutamate transporter AbgT
MSVTPRQLLSPALIAVDILSDVAVDAGDELVIPLGDVIFYAAGHHPLPAIAAAFADVAGGFSATLMRHPEKWSCSTMCPPSFVPHAAWRASPRWPRY